LGRVRGREAQGWREGGPKAGPRERPLIEKERVWEGRSRETVTTSPSVRRWWCEDGRGDEEEEEP